MYVINHYLVLHACRLQFCDGVRRVVPYDGEHDRRHPVLVRLRSVGLEGPGALHHEGLHQQRLGHPAVTEEGNHVEVNVDVQLVVLMLSTSADHHLPASAAARVAAAPEVGGYGHGALSSSSSSPTAFISRHHHPPSSPAEFPAAEVTELRRAWRPETRSNPDLHSPSSVGGPHAPTTVVVAHLHTG